MINPSTVLHKRTTVPNRTPSSLSAGEIAMNMADGTMFIPNIGGGVFTFLDQTKHSFLLQPSLSGVIPQYGNNTVSEVFGNVLGGYNNNITGAGSTTINGENNDIEGDFSFIGTGLNNKIGLAGDYSAIVGGQNNLITHQNSFTLGSNLSSHANNFTYVNNISGKFWGEASELYGSTIVPGTSSHQVATTAYVQESVTSGTAVAATIVAQVVNVDTVNLTRGMAVYAFGSQGDKVSVKRAAAGQDTTSSKTLGIVNETIAINGTGYITLGGTMDKLSLGPPFVAGDSLWLGTDPGTFTRVKPVAPIHSVFIGVVERANGGNGTAYIKIQNGYELDELHDVLITDPQASQVLQRNEANTLWVNKTLASQTPQTISFVDNTKELSISNGNTISLSALVDSSLDTGVRSLTSNWDSTYSTVQSNSAVNWNYQGTDLKALSGNWQNTYTTVQTNSASWNSVYSNVQSNSGTYVTLSGTQTLTNKTVVDWMTLVRGYKTTPTLNTTIATGEVWNYVYASSPSDKTYYRFIATDGSEDAFYASFNGTAVSNLVARKGITL